MLMDVASNISDVNFSGEDSDRILRALASPNVAGILRSLASEKGVGRNGKSSLEEEENEIIKYLLEEEKKGSLDTKKRRWAKDGTVDKMGKKREAVDDGMLDAKKNHTELPPVMTSDLESRHGANVDTPSPASSPSPSLRRGFRGTFYRPASFWPPPPPPSSSSLGGIRSFMFGMPSHSGGSYVSSPSGFGYHSGYSSLPHQMMSPWGPPPSTSSFALYNRAGSMPASLWPTSSVAFSNPSSFTLWNKMAQAAAPKGNIVIQY